MRVLFVPAKAVYCLISKWNNMPTADEQECLRKLQLGDAAAYNNIFIQYYPPLVFFARKMVQHELVAEDIVTEVFLKLWQKHQNFSNLMAMKSFLYVSTRNACINHLEQSRYHAREKENIARLANTSDENILSGITHAEVLRELFYIVKELPKQCRKIIILSFVRGLSSRQIANQLNISVHTVKNHKVRGIQLMRQKLHRVL